MTESRYELILYWDEQDSIFVVEVPELSGCMAHGATKAAALENTEEAIRFWIETAEADGVTVPKPKGRLAYA